MLALEADRWTTSKYAFVWGIRISNRKDKVGIWANKCCDDATTLQFSVQFTTV